MTAPLVDQTTAPLADQTAPQPPPPTGKAPELSVAAVSASLAGAAWAVYFASLAAVYLTAFARNVLPCQAAAGWGLAIAFAAALLAVPFAVSWPSAPRRAGLSVPRAAAWAAGGLLTLASVAVIWVAVNLTVARDTAGAWALTACAVAAPTAVLLARLALSGGTGIGAAAPPAVAVPEPHPGVAIPDVEPSADVAAVEVPLDVSEPDVALQATAPIRLVLRDGATITYPSLLAPDWEARLGSPPPRVAIDAGMWEAVLTTLGRRRSEVGGVALTVRVPRTLIVLGLVLPQQVRANGAFCEFRSEEVSRVRDAIDGVADVDSSDVKIAWVHTHPGMGPFLSGTDRATTDTWRAFDPDFTPIVLDPLAQRLKEQIGVFGRDNRKIESLRVVEGLADWDTVSQLKEQLLNAYRDAKGTMVLFGGD